MKYAGILLFLCRIVAVLGQQETFDLTTYTPPKGAKKEMKQTVVGYTITDNSKNTWCILSVYKSTTSKGSIEQDFSSEWDALVTNPYHIQKASQVSRVQDADGWKLKGGSGSYRFNQADALVMLTTMSGYGRVVSIVVLTNSEAYMPVIEAFVGSVKLKKPQENISPGKGIAQASNSTSSKSQPAVKSKFTFTTTNFDDGWIAAEQADWVQVVKGNIKVVLHYPTTGIEVAGADYKTISHNAWNILVAPRYSNLRNFTLFSGTLDYEQPYFIAGDVTDPKIGKTVYVALFKKGNSGWIEVVAPDRNSFVQVFGVDASKIEYNVDSSIWKPLQKMTGYNRFAVAASDLSGKWTNNFTGLQQYVNVYTGANAGMNTHSSAEVFEFGAGNAYQWELNVASGFVGSIKFQNVKSTGQFKLPDNWQIYFSKIENKPRTYTAYFSCVKGARILWLQDVVNPGDLTGYGKSQ